MYSHEFEFKYKSILEEIFAKTQAHLLRFDEKVDLDYDCYLSGGVVSLVILKDNKVYCANVGNVSACLLFTEKIYSFKFKILELSTDHSALKYENSKHQNGSFSKINENQNIGIIIKKFRFRIRIFNFNL